MASWGWIIIWRSWGCFTPQVVSLILPALTCQTLNPNILGRVWWAIKRESHKGTKIPSEHESLGNSILLATCWLRACDRKRERKVSVKRTSAHTNSLSTCKCGSWKIQWSLCVYQSCIHIVNTHIVLVHTTNDYKIKQVWVHAIIMFQKGYILQLSW